MMEEKSKPRVGVVDAEVEKILNSFITQLIFHHLRKILNIIIHIYKIRCVKDA